MRNFKLVLLFFCFLFFSFLCTGKARAQTCNGSHSSSYNSCECVPPSLPGRPWSCNCSTVDITIGCSWQGGSCVSEHLEGGGCTGGSSCDLRNYTTHITSDGCWIGTEPSPAASPSPGASPSPEPSWDPGWSNYHESQIMFYYDQDRSGDISSQAEMNESQWPIAFNDSNFSIVLSVPRVKDWTWGGVDEGAFAGLGGDRLGVFCFPQDCEWGTCDDCNAHGGCGMETGGYRVDLCPAGGACGCGEIIRWRWLMGRNPWVEIGNPDSGIPGVSFQASFGPENVNVDYHLGVPAGYEILNVYERHYPDPPKQEAALTAHNGNSVSFTQTLGCTNCQSSQYSWQAKPVLIGFAEVQPGSISGQVFLDPLTNCSGTNEINLTAGWTVEANGLDCSEGEGSNGRYQCLNLQPGSYDLTFTPPDTSWVKTGQTSECTPAASSPFTISGQTVTAGEAATNVNLYVVQNQSPEAALPLSPGGPLPDTYEVDTRQWSFEWTHSGQWGYYYGHDSSDYYFYVDYSDVSGNYDWSSAPCEEADGSFSCGPFGFSWGTQYFWQVRTSNNRDSFSNPLSYADSQEFTFTPVPPPWWQARGGSLHAENQVTSLIPNTASEPYLITDNDTISHGILSYGDSFEVGEGSVSSDQARALSSFAGQTRYQFGWWQLHLRDEPQETSYSGGALPNPGTEAIYLTSGGSLNISGNIGADSQVVILHPGDLTIDGDITVAPGGFLAVIASGNITIDPSVANVQGIFIADGSLEVPSAGADDLQLLAEGTFVGWTDVNLDRDIGAPSANQASMIFSYRPDFILNAPSFIKQSAYQWRQIPG